jgi:hypothetical protein
MEEPSQARTTPDPTTRDAKSKSPWWWLAVRLSPIVTVVVAVYGLWVHFGPAEPAFRPGSPSGGLPVAVSFSVTNSNRFFDLKNLTIKCALAGRIEGETGGSIVFGQPGKPVFVETDATPGLLRAGETRSHTCTAVMPKFDIGQQPKLLAAEMSFESEYDSHWLFAPRVKSVSPTFIYEGATGRWRP